MTFSLPSRRWILKSLNCVKLRMSEIRVLAFVNERIAPSATETTGARTRMILGATPFCSIPADVQQRQQKSFTLVYKITLFNSLQFYKFLLIFSLTSLAIILIRGPLLSRLTLGTRGLFLACGWMLRCRSQVDTSSTEARSHERNQNARKVFGTHLYFPLHEVSIKR